MNIHKNKYKALRSVRRGFTIKGCVPLYSEDFMYRTLRETEEYFEDANLIVYTFDPLEFRARGYKEGWLKPGDAVCRLLIKEWSGP